MFSRLGKDADAWMPFQFAHSIPQETTTSFVRRCIKHGVGLFRIAHAFSKSDYKTIIIPVTCYGFLTSSRIPGVETIIHLLAWIWLFLLQFCAANQMYSMEEDSTNKPYRPIPSGLITVESTHTLRWALVPICLYLSWIYGVLYAGISLTLAFVFYNEFGLDSYWYSKSLLNAIGIVSWNIGAACIASEGQQDLLVRYRAAPVISVALIWTTIHVQDFRDEAGDRMQGRITLPTFLPVASRYLTLCLLTAWSIGLGLFWQLERTAMTFFVIFGVYLSLRIFWQRSEAEDKVSLRLYMLWLSLAQTLPFITHWIQAF
ncbi:hypothetical protein Moror_3175 [Moniliophthora roreri MCA 2997]|uniref:UbiA prenyltransferase n=2 Tax=Moniliophthora roreri TaxID=221103 RepID=V2X7U7_MONRO|nr:hypothetical protein Moror_3175 [Moniliophthora roreri MCA 2997]KAI3613101.1 hypothetical protein WG66_001471 [Moniliophthora roreri]